MARLPYQQSGYLVPILIYLHLLVVTSRQENDIYSNDKLLNSQSYPSRDSNILKNDFKGSSKNVLRRTSRKHLNSENSIKLNYTLTSGWPVNVDGNITGIDYDNDGNVIIFHRGDHVWGPSTFHNINNIYLLEKEGPIRVDTIYTINTQSKEILHKWGKDLFYMPHGLTLDKKDFLWLTDVALHQVFKFPRHGSLKPSLTLGIRFKPGNTKDTFCKPTSVAVDSRNDDIYVADGYCNSRIVRFSSDGRYLNQWGESDPTMGRFFRAPSLEQTSPNSLSIPHKIIIIEHLDLACVADREHARIVCFKIPNGQFDSMIQLPEFSGSVYSISYSQACGGLMYAINGKTFALGGLARYQMRGFVFNFTSKELLGYFTPKSGTFDNPHDIGSSHDCKEVSIVEVGPNFMWKFEADPESNTAFNLTKRFNLDGYSIQALTNKARSIVRDKVPEIASRITSNFSTTTIVLTLLMLPIVVIIILALMIKRTRYRWAYRRSSLKNLSGWVSSYKAAKSETKLGRILNDPRNSGFNQLATEDSNTSDQEYFSESEVEEFNINTVKKI